MAQYIRAVKIRVDGKGYFSIAVPPEIGRAIPEDKLFLAELTEEGILFRPLATTHQPQWLNQQEER